LWGQLLADVTGRRVQRLAEPRFTNVRGAAFVAMAEQGRIGWGDIGGLLVVAAEHEPDAQLHHRYARQTAALELLQQNLGALHRMWEHPQPGAAAQGAHP
jgi:sugar (pentulose or hexulose) kinase